MADKRRIRLRAKMTIALEIEGTTEEQEAKAKEYKKTLEAAIKKLPGFILTSKVKPLGWDKPSDGKWEPEEAKSEPKDEE